MFSPSLNKSPHSVSFFVHIFVVILDKKFIFYVTFWFCIVAHVPLFTNLYFTSCLSNFDLYTSLFVINISFLHILCLDFVVLHLWYPMWSLIFSDLYVFPLIEFLMLHTHVTCPLRPQTPLVTPWVLLFYCTSLKIMLTLRHTPRNLIYSVFFMHVTLRYIERTGKRMNSLYETWNHKTWPERVEVRKENSPKASELAIKARHPKLVQSVSY